MQPEVYINARGETVMPLNVLKQLNADKLERQINKVPYPKHKRGNTKRARRAAHAKQ